jgi:aspartate kinase
MVVVEWVHGKSKLLTHREKVMILRKDADNLRVLRPAGNPVIKRGENRTMKVFKFGGASVNSIDRIKNLPVILQSFRGEKILVVISAMGKTTNALEKVVEAFFDRRKSDAIEHFRQIRQNHLDLATQLLKDTYTPVRQRLDGFFTEVEWLLHDDPVKSYDYYYDQIVCTGELLSTSLVSGFLEESGIPNMWMDVRDLFRTDDNFRDANIDWEFTRQTVIRSVVPQFEHTQIVLTQGFIGSTDENESTTLGREGSDYSAAIFANILNAECLTIWKDVEGVMNADPKVYDQAVIIRELNYDEVIEMAYYGAQVIHPKTIKPLQNRNIPLVVKCFLDPTLPGTVIHNSPVRQLPPIIVWKHNQALMQMHSRDFSFVGEKPVSHLYSILAELKMKPNLMQTGAVSLMICVDDSGDKPSRLAQQASVLFDVQLEKGLSLLTIRHYNETIIAELLGTRTAILRQQTPETVQFLIRNT